LNDNFPFIEGQLPLWGYTPVHWSQDGISSTVEKAISTLTSSSIHLSASGFEQMPSEA